MPGLPASLSKMQNIAGNSRTGLLIDFISVLLVLDSYRDRFPCLMIMISKSIIRLLHGIRLTITELTDKVRILHVHGIHSADVHCRVSSLRSPCRVGFAMVASEYPWHSTGCAVVLRQHYDLASRRP